MPSVLQIDAVLNLRMISCTRRCDAIGLDKVAVQQISAGISIDARCRTLLDVSDSLIWHSLSLERTHARQLLFVFATHSSCSQILLGDPENRILLRLSSLRFGTGDSDLSHAVRSSVVTIIN